MNNLFTDFPPRKSLNSPEEVIEDLLATKAVRIERIVSHGNNSSPDTGWYDQQEHEWVTVLSGQGTIQFESGEVLALGPGDYHSIQAGIKHRVVATASDQTTVWLAVFYQ